jgi:hypothetical protein
MRQQQLDYVRQLPVWTPRRRVRLAMLLGPMLVATLLPIWRVWHIGPCEATGELGTLWGALGMLPDNVRAAGLSYVVSHSGSGEGG